MSYAALGTKNSGPTQGNEPANFGTCDIETGGTVNAAVIKLAGDAVTGIVATGTVAQGIPLNNFRAPAAWKDALGDTATAAILGLADTVGSVLLATASSGASVTQGAVATFTLPHTYVAGAAITIRIRAKQATTLLTVGTTVVPTCKLIGDTLGSDLVTTSLATLTTAYAAYDFTVTPTSRVAGDEFAINVTLVADDTGGTVNTAASIARVEVRLG